MTDTTTMPDSATAAPTQFIKTSSRPTPTAASEADPPRRSSVLQHFTGTLDNWDPAVTDPLARGREIILFESAGLGARPVRYPPRSPE